MGMFDYVRFKDECPKCHKEVNGFQSKSGRCELATVNPWEVDNFYSSCDGCGTWIEYTLKRLNLSKKDYLSHYDKSVSKMGANA